MPDRGSKRMLVPEEGRMGGGCLQPCGESSEEELSVLPPHTKVVVTGNNRTKSVLVGLHGVVKKAVGLGGWHWLVLTNGIEVKLQRNALSVIEAPTGHEEEDEIECENLHWNGSDIADDDNQVKKPEKSRNRHHKGYSNKSLSRSHSSDSHSKGSLMSSSCSTKVDLSKLETTALWRYLRHFNLVDASPNPSKEHLIEVVQRHFMSQESGRELDSSYFYPIAIHCARKQLDELQVIVGFAQAAKRLKTVCN